MASEGAPNPAEIQIEQHPNSTLIAPSQHPQSSSTPTSPPAPTRRLFEAQSLPNKHFIVSIGAAQLKIPRLPDVALLLLSFLSAVLTSVLLFSVLTATLENSTTDATCPPAIGDATHEAGMNFSALHQRRRLLYHSNQNDPLISDMINHLISDYITDHPLSNENTNHPLSNNNDNANTMELEPTNGQLPPGKHTQRDPSTSRKGGSATEEGQPRSASVEGGPKSETLEPLTLGVPGVLRRTERVLQDSMGHTKKTEKGVRLSQRGKRGVSSGKGAKGTGHAGGRDKGFWEAAGESGDDDITVEGAERAADVSSGEGKEEVEEVEKEEVEAEPTVLDTWEGKRKVLKKNFKWDLSVELLAENEMIYQENVAKRASGIHTITVVNQITDPMYPCPLEERVGAWGEGGKWLCLLPGLTNGNRVPVVYSIGSQAETSFEYDISSVLGGAKPHTYDHSVDYAQAQALKQLPYMHFHHQGLTGAEPTANGSEKQMDPKQRQLAARLRTLKQMMQENGDTYIDVFKIDCEGCELEFAQYLKRHTTREKPLLGQVMVEIHHLNHNHWVAAPGADIGMVTTLESLGYRLFHSEENFFCSFCYELAFVHESLLRPAAATWF